MPPTGKDYRNSQNCMLSGWGLVKRYPQTLADQLQKVSKVTRKTCCYWLDYNQNPYRIPAAYLYCMLGGYIRHHTLIIES